MRKEMASSSAPLPWVVLGRVALVPHDSVENPGRLSLALAAPPGASTFVVPTSVHPDRENPDRHPYVVAADGNAGLLLHVSAFPSVGCNLERLPQGALILARGFLPADDAAGRDAPTSTPAVVALLPDREQYQQCGVSNLKSLGLISRPGSADAEYMVAELRIGDIEHPDALLTFVPGSDAWVERPVCCVSIPDDRLSKWSSYDVIPHDGKLWWVDLVWGFLGCDPSSGPVAALSYVDLPHSEATDHYRINKPPKFMEGHRMVRVSQGKLRFVDVGSARVDNPLGDTMVTIWTLGFHSSGEASWEMHRKANLTKIWNTTRCKPAWVSEEVPAFGLELAFLHPSDPDVVFFFLERYLFSVNVLEGRIVKFVDKECGLVEVTVPWSSGLPLINWRHVIAWVLPHPLDNELKKLASRVAKEPDGEDKEHDNREGGGGQ